LSLHILHNVCTTVVPWPFQHMSIERIINFENFISTNGIILNIHYYPSQYLEKVIKFFSNISENNIIIVKLAKVTRVCRLIACFCAYIACDHAFKEQKACNGCAFIRVFR
jgi:hypothetical protein